MDIDIFSILLQAMGYLFLYLLVVIGFPIAFSVVAMLITEDKYNNKRDIKAFTLHL